MDLGKTIKAGLTQKEADDLVASWFDLFELEDYMESVMIHHKTVKPDLKKYENKYVLNYYQNCPVFRELMNSNDSEAVAYLWRIKDFKIKLNRKSMEAAPTLTTCLSCKRTNDSQACVFRRD